MKDIDFDELDRAVSSLMGTVPKDEEKSEVPSGTAGSQDITSVPAEKPQASAADDENDTVVAVDQEPATEPTTPVPDDSTYSEDEPDQPTSKPEQPGAATPSRGRFMDVVRPSRETRKPLSSISRQGVTLQPSSPARPVSETPKRPSAEAETDFAAQATIPQDMEDTASAAASSRPAFEATPLNQSSATEEPEDTNPLSSPFLPDAKVEKRPLGRPLETTSTDGQESDSVENASETTPDPSVLTEEPTSSMPDKDAQRPEQPLPAELDSELLSIETETSVTALESTPAQSTAPEAPAPAFETPATTVPAPNPTPAKAATFTTDTQRSMAAASIPQQYKLEATQAEEVPASAIYDTQPLAHPAKSKPGWLFVLAIVGILVLGALGGAAVYYLGLL